MPDVPAGPIQLFIVRPEAIIWFYYFLYIHSHSRVTENVSCQDSREFTLTIIDPNKMWKTEFVCRLTRTRLGIPERRFGHDTIGSPAMITRM